MDTVGQGAGATEDKAQVRYFVVADGREKGPYTVEQLRLAVEETALQAESRVRAEDEADDRPLGPLLARIPKPLPKARRTRRKAGDASAETADEVLVRLRDGDDDLSRGPDGWAEHEGEYSTGVLLGFLGGCIALALSGRAKPQTRKGIYTGFVLGIVVGLFLQVVKILSWRG